jgi:hypothetical protein
LRNHAETKSSPTRIDCLNSGPNPARQRVKAGAVSPELVKQTGWFALLFCSACGNQAVDKSADSSICSVAIICNLLNFKTNLSVALSTCRAPGIVAGRFSVRVF